MNYAAHNKELHHTLELTEPTIFMKSDSSLLKDGKPFFIPDFSSEIHYETELVVKIDRLGKNIAERLQRSNSWHRLYGPRPATALARTRSAVGNQQSIRQLCGNRHFHSTGRSW